jgi:uncharacterized Tic20 family protein
MGGPTTSRDWVRCSGERKALEAMTSHPTEPFDPIAGAPPREVPPREVPPREVPPREAAYPDATYPDTEYAVAGHHEPAHDEPAHDEPPRQDAGYRATALASDAGRPYGQDGDDDQLWAMVAYLGMIFFAFLPPLAIYLFRRRESRYVRFHAAQALNLWITAVLYSISFMIIGGILALDTITTGLSVGIPLIAATGIVLLLFAVRAALAAGRGAQYRLPGWICVQVVR